MGGGGFFHALALGMAAAFEHAQMIEVFPRRDVAQRVGRTDHRRPAGVEAMDALDEGVAKAAFEQNGGEGGGGHRRQLGSALLAEWHGDPLFERTFAPCRRVVNSCRPTSRLVYERRTFGRPFDGAAAWRRPTSSSRDRSRKPTNGSWFRSSSSRTRATSPSGWRGL